jgi:hypothetical protein
MSEPLDKLIQGLKAEGPDRDLSQLEPAVWRRIEGARAAPARGMGFVPLRTAAVFMALVAGAVVGGASATVIASEPAETSAFALNAHLAPSTLLDGRR